MTNPSPAIACSNVLPGNSVGALTELLAGTVCRGVFDARFSVFIVQDAIPASGTSNRRRARIRLANPKSENNCAVFFATPR